VLVGSFTKERSADSISPWGRLQQGVDRFALDSREFEFEYA
jgi:hypothetical protein